MLVYKHLAVKKCKPSDVVNAFSWRGNTVLLCTRGPHKFCTYKIGLAVALYNIYVW